MIKSVVGAYFLPSYVRVNQYGGAANKNTVPSLTDERT